MPQRAGHEVDHAQQLSAVGRAGGGRVGIDERRRWSGGRRGGIVAGIHTFACS